MVAPKQILKKLVRLSKLIGFLAVLFGLFYYINTYHTEELRKFYLKFDVWGFTEAGRAEQQRVYAIKALQDKGIPNVQQQALIDRTVFLGATDEMVLLALGRPVKDPELNKLNQQVWIYNFDDYIRPTYLFFERKDNKWVLTKAEKANQ